MTRRGRITFSLVMALALVCGLCPAQVINPTNIVPPGPYGLNISPAFVNGAGTFVFTWAPGYGFDAGGNFAVPTGVTTSNVLPLTSLGWFNPTALPVTYSNTLQSLTVGTPYGTPGIADKSIGITFVAMGTQATNAAINVTNMTWTMLNLKNYLLRCEIPMTFTSTATVAFSLANNGGGAPTSASIDAQGGLGAAA